jgi:arylsulfatase
MPIIRAVAVRLHNLGTLCRRAYRGTGFASPTLFLVALASRQSGKSPVVRGLTSRHALRGVLIGAVAGALVGGMEASFLLFASPVARVALHEASLYAVVVDAVMVAALSGVVAALLGALAGRSQLLTGHGVERRLVRLHLAGATAFTLFATGFLWFDHVYQESHRRAGVTVPPALVVLPLLTVAAVLGALVLYRAAGRHLTGALLTQPRATAVSALAVSALLLCVLPLHVLVESRQYGPPIAEAAGVLQDRSLVLDEMVETPRPNLLVITVDALRADHVGACSAQGAATGQTAARTGGSVAATGSTGSPGSTPSSVTPNLDRLATRGTIFCQTHIHQPQTNPSLTSLFTGRLPATHGVRVHMTDRLPESVPTLATLARNGGYTTAGLPSWTSLKPAFSGLQQGFETYDASAVNEPWYLNQPILQAAAGTYRRIKDQLWLGRSFGFLQTAQVSVEEDIDGRADVTTDRAITWLATAPRQPFFLWLHYFDPHWPWTPPTSYAAQADPGFAPPPGDIYDGTLQTFLAWNSGHWAPRPRDVQHLQALYQGEVAYTDAQLGRLLDELEQTGEAENTLIVVTADHGEGLGEHALWIHGGHLYEQEIRVPLLFAGPGIPAGGQPAQLARQVDVLPTILDLLDLPKATGLDGTSLVDAIQGGASDPSRVSFAQTADDSSLALVTSDLWKLVIDYRRNSLELFSLREDPQELDNRAPRDSERVAALLLDLRRWTDSHGMPHPQLAAPAALNSSLGN